VNKDLLDPKATQVIPAVQLVLLVYRARLVLLVYRAILVVLLVQLVQQVLVEHVVNKVSLVYRDRSAQLVPLVHRV